MLKPEQAKERLAEWHLPPESNRYVDGIKSLPISVQAATAMLCGLVTPEQNKQGGDWYTKRQHFAQAAFQLESATIADRAAAFTLIAPQLAPAMESAWQLLKTGPYQTGYARRAFRAPRHPHLFVHRHGDWCASLAQAFGKFRPEILTAQWLAAWAPHLQLGYYSNGEELGVLLAGVLEMSGPDSEPVFEILGQSLTNEHEIGGMGRHVYTAYLRSQRRDGWELIEKTLLAAQRQEGLRQAILEAIDETHPEAFRRMLRLILDHDLIRFSAVVRAVDVWFGHMWSAASPGVIKNMLTQVVGFIENPAARTKAVRGKDPEAAFLALWAAGTEDAVESVELAQTLLSAKQVELRYVAVRHLTNLNLDIASIALLSAIGDEDLRVALWALLQGDYQADFQERFRLADDNRFERTERLLERVPTRTITLKPLVWPWTEIEIKQSDVAAQLLGCRNGRPATRLIPHLPKLETYTRAGVVKLMAHEKPWDAATRQALLDLAGDATEGTRQAALGALQEAELTAAEAQQLEGYLTRKASDLRRGLLALLSRQNDEAALASSQRLLAAKDANQRLAGLELLRLLVESQRVIAAAREDANAYQAARKKLTKEEQTHLAEIAKDKESVVSLSDALGLLNPAERTPLVAPRQRNVKFLTPTAFACLQSLDDLIHEHRETPVTVNTYAGPREELLGTIGYSFPDPDYDQPSAGQEQRLPLADTWNHWLRDRGPELRDDDGMELVRAMIAFGYFTTYGRDKEEQWFAENPERKQLRQTLCGDLKQLKLKYSGIVRDVLAWLLFLYPQGEGEYLLDAAESALALVPPADHEALRHIDPNSEAFQRYDAPIQDWREITLLTAWGGGTNWNYTKKLNHYSPAQQVRLWRLMAWLDEPVHGALRQRVDGELLLTAYEQQAANIADIAEHLLGPRQPGRYGRVSFELLESLTVRAYKGYQSPWLNAHSEVREFVARAVARILDLELNRGDVPSAATAPAHAIGALWGVETLRRILHTLGKADFKAVQRYGYRRAIDRRESLTDLAKSTYLGDAETPADFVQVMKAAVKADQFPEERLLQLTFLAPQWTPCVEAYFGWDQMREGVYWFLAHMRYISGLDDAAMAAAETGETSTADDQAGNAEGAAQTKLSAWERLILERTPLTDDERNEGAIDVAWFRRTYEQLGDKRWQALAAAARFAANPSQAKRAQFIADVLLNRASRKQLIDGIKKKQLKESVRLLGLLPLAKGVKRDTDLLERCKVLREYRRYANQLSGLTKPSALRSWEIGMKNLAQTAGFADPLRLEWAVGAEAVKDLAQGPVSLTKGGVKVTLALDELSLPQVTANKSGKELKSIPPDVKKDKKVAELVARATDIKRQAAGIRQSLEVAMCRGDTFTGEELRAWCGHALVARLLSRLIVIGDGILGYPDKGGKALRDHAGKFEPVKPKEALRLAHPYDLLQTDAWHAWQKECFHAERVQPFKQVFRELYVLTKQEKKDATISHRYDGQQIQPKQATALFGSRGWNTQDGIFKVFHDVELTACVHFQSGVTTPLEVEGATLAGVSFTKRDVWKPVELKTVPPRLFSEVMRDLDLVVSVAHAGGVDPEASASTVEMRAGLVRETCLLLNCKNVRLKPNHAVIDGEYAQYSVHLGSGSVHKLPGGSLCLVPVHAQQRGRLFLPFADNDPRTAEVISKVLLLARDHEIQDPTILEQIRAT